MLYYFLLTNWTNERVNLIKCVQGGKLSLQGLLENLLVLLENLQVQLEVNIKFLVENYELFDII